jgi:hypothetical protein
MLVRGRSPRYGLIVRCLVLALAPLAACGERSSKDAEPPRSCTVEGTTHQSGTLWTCSDRCNTCSCTNGQVTSTPHACAPGQDGGALTEPSWTQGAPCIPGARIEYVPEDDAGVCLIACECDTTSHVQCVKNCSYPRPFHDPECAQDGKCQRGVGCTSGTPPNPQQCMTGCICDAQGHYQCIQNCPNQCGLPSTVPCTMCAAGPNCLHYALVADVCEPVLCPEDGVVMPL